MIRLVAFDWNGTLFADTAPIVAADNEVLEALGRKPITIQHFRNVFTIPLLDYYAACGVDRDYYFKHQERIGKLFHDAYEARVTKVRTRTGSRRILAWLEKQNIDRIIFSNHTEWGINTQLERLGIKHHFQTILARNNVVGPVEKREKGAKLETYIESHGYQKIEVLVVGDSIEEIEISKTLGLRSVAIAGGYCSTTRLKAANPDFLIHNLLDLEHIMTRL